MSVKLEVAHDVGTERPAGVRERGALEAGMELFRDRGAAYYRAPLQHQRLQPGPRQIEGRDQGVMAPTDDDDVAVGRQSLDGSFLPVLQEFERGQPARGAHDAAPGMRS